MRIFSLSLFSLMVTSGLITAQVDFELSDVRFNAGPFNSVPAGMVSPIQCTITNADTVVADSGLSITITVVTPASTFQSVAVLNQDLQPDSSLIHAFASAQLYAFGSVEGSQVITAFITATGDPTPQNDTVAPAFFVSTGVDNDWSVSSVTVIEPENLDGFDIDNGTNIPPSLSHVELEIVNNSEVSYLTNSPISYNIILAGQIIPIVVRLNGPLATDESTLRSVTNLALLPQLPDSVGEYALCAFSTMPNDLSPGNDTGCFVFSIVDNYDPNDPKNWPSGIEEVQDDLRFRIEQRHLIYTGTSPAEDLRITDLSGRCHKWGTAMQGERISLELLPAGFYVIGIRSGVETTHSVIALQH